MFIPYPNRCQRFPDRDNMMKYINVIKVWTMAAT